MGTTILRAYTGFSTLTLVQEETYDRCRDVIWCVVDALVAVTAVAAAPQAVLESGVELRSGGGHGRRRQRRQTFTAALETVLALASGIGEYGNRLGVRRRRMRVHWGGQTAVRCVCNASDADVAAVAALAACGPGRSRCIGECGFRLREHWGSVWRRAVARGLLLLLRLQLLQHRRRYLRRRWRRTWKTSSSLQTTAVSTGTGSEGEEDDG